MTDDKMQTDELINKTVQELQRALSENETPIETEIPKEEKVDYREAVNKTENDYSVPSGSLPVSLSIEAENSLLIRVANIGDRLPIKATRIFSAGTDVPDALAVRLYAGERLFAQDNHLVAELKLDGIKKLPYGRPIVSVVIDIDHDLNINIDATDEGSLVNAKVCVGSDWVPPADEIINMVKDASANAAADAERASKVRKLHAARESLCKAELNYKNVKNQLSGDKVVKYGKYMRELKSKLKKIKSCDMTDVVEKSLTDAVNKLNAIVSPE